MGLFGRSKRKSRVETLGFHKPISATDQYYLNQAQQKANDSLRAPQAQPSRAYSLSGQAASTALYAHNQRQNSLTSYIPPSAPAYDRRTMSLNSGSLRSSYMPRKRLNSITSTTTSVLVKTTKETLQDGSTKSITRQTIQDLGDYEIVQTTRIVPKSVVPASDNELEALIGDFDQDFQNEIDYIPEEEEAMEDSQENSNDNSSGYYSVYSDAEAVPTIAPRSNLPSPRQPIEHSDSITSSNLRKNVKFHAPPQQPRKKTEVKKRVQLTDEEMYSKAMEVAMAKVYGDRLESMQKTGNATESATKADTPPEERLPVDGNHASKELADSRADTQARHVPEKKSQPIVNGKSDGESSISLNDAATGCETPPTPSTPPTSTAQKKFFKRGTSNKNRKQLSKQPSADKPQLMRRVLALFDLA